MWCGEGDGVGTGLAIQGLIAGLGLVGSSFRVQLPVIVDRGCLLRGTWCARLNLSLPVQNYFSIKKHLSKPFTFIHFT